jgi:hypothetical protein
MIAHAQAIWLKYPEKNAHAPAILSKYSAITYLRTEKLSEFLQ